MILWNFFKSIYFQHKDFWTKERCALLIGGILFFVAALVLQGVAGRYLASVVGTPVNDLILKYLPLLDIDLLIVQGALVLTFILIWLFLTKPKYLLFALKALALFVMIRSFFITLTHLGISPHQLVFDANSFGFGLYNFLYNSKSDFFFSGHTGVPFLMGLIFWPEKWWRIFFFTVSFLFGCGVLIARVHYSIDVFAAPFITYAIFAMAKKLFPKDYFLLRS
ncbi:MAG: phosphatase PAP2-related protein [Patescibacteria group bacterium]|jgi:hypothetical protein